MFEVIRTLDFDKKLQVKRVDDCSLYVLRPSKVSRRFKNYDPKRNFQVWLKEGNEESFKPNHLRVLLDLNLRVRSNPDLKEVLLEAFDAIFYGEDPMSAIKPLQGIHFEHFLNPLPIIAHMSQLFIIEQTLGYTSAKKSKYDPPSLFYQGWVRSFIDGSREIDQLCMSASRRQPPSIKYTKLENKNRKEYLENPPKLWYLKK